MVEASLKITIKKTMPTLSNTHVKLPVTEKMLIHWAGQRVFNEGQALFKSGAVAQADYTHPDVKGILTYGNRELHSGFRILDDQSVENRCPCRDNKERGLICSHLIALANALIVRHSDPERMRKAQEERRRAERLSKLDESDYLQRVPLGTGGAEDATVILSLDKGWEEQMQKGRIALNAQVDISGKRIALSKVSKDRSLALSKSDEALLFVLEDIAEGPAQDRMETSIADFLNVLRLSAGKSIVLPGRDEPAMVNDIEMTPMLRMDMDPENGELILMIHTELPFMNSGRLPIYIVSGKSGWIYDAGHFWKLNRVLPGPLQSIYSNPIVVERPSVPRFMSSELPLILNNIQVETDIYQDLFTIAPAEPRFHLQVKGSPASVSGELLAQYGNGAYTMIASKADAEGDFSVPDPDDLMTYRVRNPLRETQALAQLAESGLAGNRGDHLAPVIGTGAVLNFLGSQLPRLRRLGWRVELAGRIEPFMEDMDFATPVVDVNRKKSSGSGWFEVGFNFEDSQGSSLSAAEIQRALQKGESFIKRGDRTLLLDADAIHRAQDVFEDCISQDGSEPGTFRMSDVYASYVKDSLDALDGIDVESDPEWKHIAQIQNRATQPEAEALHPDLETTLRPYQKDGVYWMRFLEAHGFCGILADEMGLGKTLQTLAWIERERLNERARDLPVLIVCPTSLVENWEEESEKFTPHLKVLAMSGPDRHQHWDSMKDYDIVVTSYALLRRDAAAYAEQKLAALILDEAQHIKNRSTQNAVAAKSLKAEHRMVLTGTPMENGVADLWSIMDFLMPGYMGGYKLFKERYETPIENGGTDAEYAQKKLRRKVHPFLMRRLKKDVAKELPPQDRKNRHHHPQQRSDRGIPSTGEQRQTELVEPGSRSGLQ